MATDKPLRLNGQPSALAAAMLDGGPLSVVDARQAIRKGPADPAMQPWIVALGDRPLTSFRTRAAARLFAEAALPLVDWHAVAGVPPTEIPLALDGRPLGAVLSRLKISLERDTLGTFHAERALADAALLQAQALMVIERPPAALVRLERAAGGAAAPLRWTAFGDDVAAIGQSSGGDPRAALWGAARFGTLAFLGTEGEERGPAHAAIAGTVPVLLMTDEQASAAEASLRNAGGQPPIRLQPDETGTVLNPIARQVETVSLLVARHPVHAALDREHGLVTFTAPFGEALPFHDLAAPARILESWSLPQRFGTGDPASIARSAAAEGPLRFGVDLPVGEENLTLTARLEPDRLGFWRPTLRFDGGNRPLPLSAASVDLHHSDRGQFEQDPAGFVVRFLEEAHNRFLHEARTTERKLRRMSDRAPFARALAKHSRIGLDGLRHLRDDGVRRSLALPIGHPAGAGLQRAASRLQRRLDGETDTGRGKAALATSELETLRGQVAKALPRRPALAKDPIIKLLFDSDSDPGRTTMERRGLIDASRRVLKSRMKKAQASTLESADPGSADGQKVGTGDPSYSIGAGYKGEPWIPTPPAPVIRTLPAPGRTVSLNGWSYQGLRPNLAHAWPNDPMFEDRRNALRNMIDPLARKALPREAGSGLIIYSGYLLAANPDETGRMRYMGGTGATIPVRADDGTMRHATILTTASPGPRNTLYHEALHVNFREGRLYERELEPFQHPGFTTVATERYGLSNYTHPHSVFEESLAYFVGEHGGADPAAGRAGAGTDSDRANLSLRAAFEPELGREVTRALRFGDRVIDGGVGRRASDQTFKDQVVDSWRLNGFDDAQLVPVAAITHRSEQFSTGVARPAADPAIGPLVGPPAGQPAWAISRDDYLRRMLPDAATASAGNIAPTAHDPELVQSLRRQHAEAVFAAVAQGADVPDRALAAHPALIGLHDAAKAVAPADRRLPLNPPSAPDTWQRRTAVLAIRNPDGRWARADQPVEARGALAIHRPVSGSLRGYRLAGAPDRDGPAVTALAQETRDMEGLAPPHERRRLAALADLLDGIGKQVVTGRPFAEAADKALSALRYRELRDDLASTLGGAAAPVYEPVTSRTGWVLSHLPTGMALTGNATPITRRDDAKQIVESLTNAWPWEQVTFGTLPDLVRRPAYRDVADRWGQAAAAVHAVVDARKAVVKAVASVARAQAELQSARLRVNEATTRRDALLDLPPGKAPAAAGKSDDTPPTRVYSIGNDRILHSRVADGQARVYNAAPADRGLDVAADPLTPHLSETSTMEQIASGADASFPLSHPDMRAAYAEEAGRATEKALDEGARGAVTLARVGTLEDPLRYAAGSAATDLRRAAELAGVAITDHGEDGVTVAAADLPALKPHLPVPIVEADLSAEGHRSIYAKFAWAGASLTAAAAAGAGVYLAGADAAGPGSLGPGLGAPVNAVSDTAASHSLGLDIPVPDLSGPGLGAPVNAVSDTAASHSLGLDTSADVQDFVTKAADLAQQAGHAVGKMIDAVAGIQFSVGAPESSPLGGATRDQANATEQTVGAGMSATGAAISPLAGPAPVEAKPVDTAEAGAEAPRDQASATEQTVGAGMGATGAATSPVAGPAPVEAKPVGTAEAGAEIPWDTAGSDTPAPRNRRPSLTQRAMSAMGTLRATVEPLPLGTALAGVIDGAGIAAIGAAAGYAAGTGQFPGISFKTGESAKADQPAAIQPFFVRPTPEGRADALLRAQGIPHEALANRLAVTTALLARRQSEPQKRDGEIASLMAGVEILSGEATRRQEATHTATPPKVDTKLPRARAAGRAMGD